MFVDPCGELSWRTTLTIVGFVFMGIIPSSLNAYIVNNVPSQEDHYSRNENNIVPSKEELESIVLEEHSEWEKQPDDENKYHRFTHGVQGDEAVYNKKYMTKDKKNEVIICYDKYNMPQPYIVTDPINLGTYYL